MMIMMMTTNNGGDEGDDNGNNNNNNNNKTTVQIFSSVPCSQTSQVHYVVPLMREPRSTPVQNYRQNSSPVYFNRTKR
jgi:hypothetical protein